MGTRSMFWQDLKNGEKHQVYNCETRYDQISDSNVHIQNDSVSLGETEICEIHFGSEGDLPVCRNSLASIQYTILHGHDDDNKIYAAYADVVVTDIYASTSNTNHQIVMEQEYSILFQSAHSIPRSQQLANFINRSKSGNPG